MKTSILISILISFSFSQTTWTVDNDITHAANFRSIQTANDTSIVSAGDILLVSGSATNYGNIVLDKQLDIRATGYLLQENNKASVFNKNVLVNYLTFNTGSENSTVSGLELKYSITINTSDITVKRCRQSGQRYYGVYVKGSNFTLMQSMVYEISFSSGSNITIKNNSVSSDEYGTSLSGTGCSNVFVYQNVIHGNTYDINGQLENNILRSTTIDTLNTYLINNIASVDIGSKDGNQSNVVLSTVFVSSGTTDSKWNIQTSSVADGSGSDGYDIGMYGGATPYVLSGIPNIPYIYDTSVQGISTGNTLKVRIKARIEVNN